MRNIIFHYHFFKNAGTSVDAVLKKNFPDLWVTKEFNGVHSTNTSHVAQWIKQEQEAVVFSSHTAMLPPAKIKGIQVWPIVFVRHPIDRIASAYIFERKQGGDTLGSVIARHTTLAGYIEIHLSLGHSSQCRNFHTSRFAHMHHGEEGSIADLALKAVDELPFIGLVEAFDDSIQRLSEWLTPAFPDFKPLSANANVTRDNTLGLEQKLDDIRKEIGDACYEKLLDANKDDLVLFEKVRDRYKDT